MSLPQADTLDLQALYASKGLKNLEDFKVKATLSRARRNAEALIKTDPVDGYQSLALIHAYSNNLDLAIENFKKAILLDSNNYRLLANYSLVLNDAGHILEALEVNLKALELNPLESRLFYRLNHFSNWYLYPDYQEKSFEIYKGKIEQVDDQPASLENTKRILEYLNNQNINIETFRQQLLLANNICNRLYRSDRVHLLSEINLEFGYMSRVLYLKDSTPKEVVHLNSIYEAELLNWLEQQNDGGFSLAQELDELILYFSVA